jgi:hypothetical protein
VAVAELGEFGRRGFEEAVVDVFAVEDGSDFDEEGRLDDDVLEPCANGLFSQKYQVVRIVKPTELIASFLILGLIPYEEAFLSIYS